MYDFLHANKEWGNGYYTLPVFATAWAAGKLFDELPAAQRTGEWGERCLRTFLVGAPPMLLSQRLTGASRPGETADDSRWHPLQDSNGVSGHSFMGSLPFINMGSAMTIVALRPAVPIVLSTTPYAGRSVCRGSGDSAG